MGILLAQGVGDALQPAVPVRAEREHLVLDPLRAHRPIIIIMYALIFAAVLRLRYTRPEVRPFRIPGGTAGVWITAAVGLVGCLLSFVLGFVPPDQLKTGSPVLYVGGIALGLIVLALPPFLVRRRPPGRTPPRRWRWRPSWASRRSVTAVAIAVALVAALLFAVAFVMQQRAASEVPDDESLGLGLITRLVRRPIWLIGTGADTLGYVAQAVALGLASLVLVQPLLATSLLFALPLGAWWAKRRPQLGRRLGGRAHRRPRRLPGRRRADRRRRPRRRHRLADRRRRPRPGHRGLRARGRAQPAARRAVLLAAATGILYGVAALTKSTVSLLDDGFVGS